jgi:hypothetical protein
MYVREGRVIDATGGPPHHASMAAVTIWYALFVSTLTLP